MSRYRGTDLWGTRNVRIAYQGMSVSGLVLRIIFIPAEAYEDKTAHNQRGREIESERKREIEGEFVRKARRGDIDFSYERDYFMYAEYVALTCKRAIGRKCDSTAENA